jgi:hypothetical protein
VRWGKNSQEPNAEDGAQKDLLPNWELQLPEYQKRHSAGEEVLHDAGNIGAIQRPHFVQAEVLSLILASPEGVDLIPEGVDGAATEDKGILKDEHVGHNRKDGGVDDPDEGARDSAGDQAAVEKQDGYFYQGSREDVKCLDNHDKLGGLVNE